MRTSLISSQKTRSPSRGMTSHCQGYGDLCAPIRRGRTGFSFTELLFAVMILGIGFILVAAIFPVGLAQTKSNFDETQTASLARSASATLQRLAKESDFNNTAITPLQLPGGTNVPTRIAQDNMISPADPRYAWVGLYRRTAVNNKTAQLILFVVNRSQPFTAADFNVQDGVRSLEPRPVRLDVNNGIFTISNLSVSNGNQYNASAASPGSFLVIANDNLSDTTAQSAIYDRDDPTNSTYNTAAQAAVTPGFLNGRIFRLGSQSGSDFQAFPGYEFDVTFQYDHDGNPATPKRTAVVPRLVNAQAYIVGRNRTGSANDFEGTTMDVACYTTFIPLK